jgi:hypothetical protein
MRGRRVMTLVGVLALLIVTQAVAAPLGAAGAQFGSNFTADTGLDNEFNCTNSDPCTGVQNHAFVGSGTTQLPLKAQFDGTITKIKLLSDSGDDVRLFLARTKSNPTRSKLVRKGPILNINDSCNPDCSIQTINVSIPVHKGDVLAFRPTTGTSAGFMRCNSGSPNILEFQPPLVVGNSFQQPDDTDGCDVLWKAVYRH